MITAAVVVVVVVDKVVVVVVVTVVVVDEDEVELFDVTTEYQLIEEASAPQVNPRNAHVISLTFWTCMNTYLRMKALRREHRSWQAYQMHQPTVPHFGKDN